MEDERPDVRRFHEMQMIPLTNRGTALELWVAADAQEERAS